MLWIGQVEDAKSIDDLITSASMTGGPTPDSEKLDFKIASGLTKILTGTSINKSPKPKDELNQSRVPLQADLLLG